MCTHLHSLVGRHRLQESKHEWSSQNIPVNHFFLHAWTLDVCFVLSNCIHIQRQDGILCNWLCMSVRLSLQALNDFASNLSGHLYVHANQQQTEADHVHSKLNYGLGQNTLQYIPYIMNKSTISPTWSCMHTQNTLIYSVCTCMLVNYCYMLYSAISWHTHISITIYNACKLSDHVYGNIITLMHNLTRTFHRVVKIARLIKVAIISSDSVLHKAS